MLPLSRQCFGVDICCRDSSCSLKLPWKSHSHVTQRMIQKTFGDPFDLFRFQLNALWYEKRLKFTNVPPTMSLFSETFVIELIKNGFVFIWNRLWISVVELQVGSSLSITLMSLNAKIFNWKCTYSFKLREVRAWYLFSFFIIQYNNFFSL